MAIFNSLGSNYNLTYVLKSFFADSDEQGKKLKNFLENKYQGKVFLTYKGREALTLALSNLSLPKESCAAINGFTCFAVYKAIEQAGITPICLDLEEKNSDLNFSAETLEKALTKNKKIKVVVIQNTLGYPCDIEKIAKICREKNIILIEDLAHCAGTKYQNGQEAGRAGDFVTLSFSQDKVIDAVSGGALVIRNKQYGNKLKQQFSKVNNFQQFKDHLYPVFTYKIRFFYGAGFGKLLHYILRRLNLLSKPVQEDLYDFYSLPDWHCNLALNEFVNLKKQLNHRKKIARIYARKLNKKILEERIADKIDFSANLRFPILTKNRNSLVKFLKSRKIYIADIWYDDVAKDCPNAVAISKIILNLPTHINVTEKNALKIAESINIWMRSQ